MASQKYRRILTIVIDSIGVGDAPDADKYNSDGADTLGHMAQWWVDNQGRPLALPNMERLGLGRVRPGKPFAGVSADTEPAGGFGRMRIISLRGVQQCVQVGDLGGLFHVRRSSLGRNGRHRPGIHD